MKQTVKLLEKTNALQIHFSAQMVNVFQSMSFVMLLLDAVMEATNLPIYAEVDQEDVWGATALFGAETEGVDRALLHVQDEMDVVMELMKAVVQSVVVPLYKEGVYRSLLWHNFFQLYHAKNYVNCFYLSITYIPYL